MRQLDDYDARETRMIHRLIVVCLIGSCFALFATFVWPK